MNIVNEEDKLPQIELHFPEIVELSEKLAEQYSGGYIDTRGVDIKVRETFTPEFIHKIDKKLPGWEKMSKYADGKTLVHIICVFMSMIICHEYQTSSPEQKRLLNWIALLHDIGKEIREGQRDFTHGFRSGAISAKILPELGFHVTVEYPTIIDDWYKLAESAIREKDGALVQDNSKLGQIIDGIDRMFGIHSPSSYIIKTILLHQSLEGEKEWPCPVPLSEDEIRKYIDTHLLKLLKVMMLADSTAWNLFDKLNKEQYRKEILESIDKVKQVIGD